MSIQADGLLLRHHALRRPDARALGDPDLRLDDVDTSHLLGHGVLDLNARIHLDEVERAAVHIHQELDRACMGIPCSPRQP